MELKTLKDLSFVFEEGDDAKFQIQADFKKLIKLIHLIM